MAKKTTKKSAQRYAMDAELTIYHVQQIKELLLDALTQTDELEVDLSAVREIDGAGLQLLLALKQEANRMNKKLRCTGHSADVVEVVELCDLGAYFGDPMVLPSHVH